MRGVLTSCYEVGGTLSLVIGAQMKSQAEIAVELLQSEKVIFSLSDWQIFIEEQGNILDFFNRVTDELALKLDGVVSLVNISDRELVLKSTDTWNTIRLNHQNFLRILEISPLIRHKINKLNENLHIVTLLYHHLLNSTVQLIRKDYEVVEELGDLLKIRLTSDDHIRRKIRDIACDEISQELATIYQGRILQWIREAL